MASCDRITSAIDGGPPEECPFCQSVPCVGDDCPSNWDDDDDLSPCAACGELAGILYPASLCSRCHRRDRDHVTGEENYWDPEPWEDF